MVTKIGFNIETKTAREHDLFLQDREARTYYTDAFEYSIRKKLAEIVSKFDDKFTFEIKSETTYLKSGNCLNSIVLLIRNDKGFDKKTMKDEISKYLSNHFKSRFNFNQL
jgi:hypothetical protein